MRRPDEIDTYDLVRHLRLERLRQAEQAHAAYRRLAWALCALGTAMVVAALVLGTL